MNTLDAVDAASLRDDVPDFRPGDTLKVHVRVIEGNKSRVQVFQGVVIRRQGGGLPRDLHRPQGQLSASASSAPSRCTPRSSRRSRS